MSHTSIKTQTFKKFADISIFNNGFPGEGNGTPLQYSCLENPMDGGAWYPWGRKELGTTERLHFHFTGN